MDARTLLMLAFQVSILATVFSFGLSTRISDLLYLVRQPGLLVRSLVAVLVIMPVFAVLLVRLFDLRQTIEIVLVALAISPIPPLLPNREGKGGGRQAYGLALMAIMSLLSIVTVPLTVEVLERVFGRPLGVEPGAVAVIVLKMALLPLAAGLAVRAALPALADRLDNVISLIATVLLVLASLALLAGTWRAIWEAAGSGANLVAMIAFVAVGLVVGHVMGGPEPENSLVLALSTACRHPMIAFSIASANFPDQRFGASILLYIIINVLVGAVYVAWYRRQRTAVVPA
jgi:BASS family bile acid:Na+ symporter